MKVSEANLCSKCYKVVVLGDGVKHETCEHMSHYHCLDKDNPDFLNCYQCKGGKDLVPVKEITNVQGHNYILNPMFVKYDAFVMDPIFNTEPSIERLIIGEECHLQLLLYYGVTIDHLLEIGYDHNDLVKFADMSHPGEQRLRALYALQCTAEHFRDYPKKLPVKELEISPVHLVEKFGLRFPDGQDSSLITDGGKNNIPWKMSDLLALGFTADTIFGTGLYSYAQLKSLCPTDSELAKAKFTQKQIDQLYPPKVSPVKPKPREPAAYEKAMRVMSVSSSGVHLKPPRRGLRKK